MMRKLIPFHAEAGGINGCDALGRMIYTSVVRGPSTHEWIDGRTWVSSQGHDGRVGEKLGGQGWLFTW